LATADFSRVISTGVFRSVDVVWILVCYDSRDVGDFIVGSQCCAARPGHFELTREHFAIKPERKGKIRIYGFAIYKITSTYRGESYSILSI
jgi:hypothetical protein